MDFIDRLRRNNVFPAGIPNMGQMNSGPDWNSMVSSAYNMAVQENERDRDFQREMFNRKANLDRVAQSMRQPEPQKPMNIVYQPGITDFQRAGLGLRERELEQKGDIASGKLGVQDRETDIKQQRANVYKWKAEHPEMELRIQKGGDILGINPQTGAVIHLAPSGTLSDSDLWNLKASHEDEQIDRRGNIQKDLQKGQGQQRLSEIAAQVAGRKEIEAGKAQKTQPPSQQKVDVQNRAAQLKNTRPDLAQYVTINADGTVSIADDVPPREQEDIQSALYGKDTTLPSYTNKSVQPKTDNDPLGLRKK